MRKVLLILILVVAVLQEATAQNTIRVLDSILYFDGYAATVTTPAPPAGVIRHRNDLYARKLTAAELQSIGYKMHMKVTVKAACDNYDRIGNVNMALVPKGATTYNPDSVKRIELGRYITPFMNKNYQPTSVPYDFDIENVSLLLKETSIIANYDIWIELELFGVPYAANTQVAGCAGRNDVFYGSVEFTTTSTPIPTQSNNVLIPLNFKKNLNNYQAAATDTIGKTTRTINFNVPNNLTDAALFLITSNHGANSGGEEYNRRNHYVYFDNTLKLTYKPGRISCEPFRQYNTQGNGIYGSSARTDAQWQSFSNWCPGDVITTRRIDLGAVAAGNHSFMITVPDAVFANGEGYFPVSLYLQGKTSGTLGTTEIIRAVDGLKIYPNPAGNEVAVEMKQGSRMEGITLLNTLGAVVYQNNNPASNRETIRVQQLPAGLYLLQVRTSNGTSVQKLQVAH